MTEKTYRQAFEQAKADLASAIARKDRATAEAASADVESIHLRRAVTALAALCGENVEDSMGLTEAVRRILTVEHWRTLKTIKEQVEQLGVGLSDLKNPDASILSVLNRLVASKEFEVMTARVGNASQRVWKKTGGTTEEAPMEPITDDDIPF